MSSDNPNRVIIEWPNEQGPLPFDCLVCICEFLQPEDLVEFMLACRVSTVVALITCHRCTLY